MSAHPPLLVGVDVGTTRTKAAIIGLDGRELARAAVPTIWRQCPTGADAQPADFLAAVIGAVAAVLAGGPPGEVLGVGVASLAETAVLIDAGGRPLGPAVAWYDRRAEDEVARMRRDLTPAEVDHRTGLTPELIPTVSTVGWLLRHDSALRAASSSLSVAEWVVHGLGGSLAAETSLASRTGALAITAGRWWAEAIRCAGLPATIFPELRSAGSSWGRVSRTDGGLERLRGATLTVAGHDHLVAAIGSGVTGAHQAMDSCGTAEALVRATPADPSRDPAQGLSRGISTGRHVLPGHYSLLAGLQLGIELIPLLDRLDAAHRAGATSLDDAALAMLDQRLTDAEATPAARQWLTAMRDAVGRATASLRRLEELGGPITELYVSGGWASNPILRRLKAEAFPAIVYPRVVEAGARGAALLAGQAAGVFASAAAFPAPLGEDEPPAAHRASGALPAAASPNPPTESVLP